MSLDIFAKFILVSALALVVGCGKDDAYYRDFSIDGDVLEMVPRLTAELKCSIN